MKRVADIDLAHPLNKVDIADEHIVDPDRRSGLKKHIYQKMTNDSMMMESDPVCC